MSLTTTLNADNSSNFTFDSSKIEFIDDTARLKLQTGSLAFAETYDSDTGFSYDGAKAEFSSGVLRQLSQLPANALFGSTFSTNINTSWPINITGIDTGLPLISGGYFVCAGANYGLYYENALVAQIQNQGTIKFKYRPNYSGTPVFNGGCMALSQATTYNGPNQLILLHSASGGTWRITARSSANTVVHNAAVIGAAWSPVAGQTYEIELVLDTQGAGIRLFINGVLHGTLATTFTRSGTATRLHIGTNPTYGDCLADFAQVVAFSDVQHAAGYTPGYTLPEATYVETSASLPLWTHEELGTMLSFTSLAETATGARYSISIDGGSFHYWNGSMWMPSNGTYAQASSLATVNAHAASLSVEEATEVQLKVHFQNTNTQSSISSSTFNYTGQTQYPTDDPYITVNSGSHLDDLLAFEADYSGDVRFVLIKNSMAFYWDGDAWVSSDSTWAQANDASDIDANSEAFTDTGVLFKLRALLRSEDGQSTPELTSATFSYDFYAPVPEVPEKCVVFGFISDILAMPIENTASRRCRIKVESENYFWASGYFIPKGTWYFLPDETGYWEADLIQGAVLTISVDYVDTLGRYQNFEVGSATIPAEISKNFKDLTYS